MMNFLQILNLQNHNETEYEDTQKVPVFIFNGLEIDLKEVFDDEVMR